MVYFAHVWQASVVQNSLVILCSARVMTRNWPRKRINFLYVSLIDGCTPWCVGCACIVSIILVSMRLLRTFAGFLFIFLECHDESTESSTLHVGCFCAYLWWLFFLFKVVGVRFLCVSGGRKSVCIVASKSLPETVAGLVFFPNRMDWICRIELVACGVFVRAYPLRFLSVGVRSLFRVRVYYVHDSGCIVASMSLLGTVAASCFSQLSWLNLPYRARCMCGVFLRAKHCRFFL